MKFKQPDLDMEQYGKDSMHLKRQSASQKKKVISIVVEQSSLPQIQLKMMEPNVYILNET